MVATTYSYRPDYAVPPGWVLDEHLKSHSLSQAEFARRCGRSAKLISEIIAGKAPVESKTALQFERVLGLDANIWLGMEARYRLHQAREAEAKETRSAADWAKTFPVKELVKRGEIEKPGSESDAVSKLLAFFGVGSVRLWFSLFHESAHILLHSKKTVFIDGTQAGGKVADIETQADQWASDLLARRHQRKRLGMPQVTKDRSTNLSELQQQTLKIAKWEN